MIQDAEAMPRQVLIPKAGTNVTALSGWHLPSLTRVYGSPVSSFLG